jgi:hypothetical protein
MLGQSLYKDLWGIGKVQMIVEPNY